MNKEVRNQGEKIEENLRLFYQWLVKPLEEDLDSEKINNLVFVMDDGLRMLPLAALIYTDDQVNYRYLVQKYSVGLMPSFSLTETSYNSINNEPVLAMGAETFKTEENPGDLPNADIAVNTVIKIMGGLKFFNDDFTLDKLNRQREINENIIVHLSTHAVIKGDENNSKIWFFERTISLKQLREPEKEEDKINLDNPTIELLVLSACQTAEDIKDVEDAELGFAGIAKQAQVKSVLASIWTVNDFATLALMAQFYRELKEEGTTKAEALQKAQKAMLNGEIVIKNNQLILPPKNENDKSLIIKLDSEKPGSIDLTHPQFWSGFTMIGNPW